MAQPSKTEREKTRKRLLAAEAALLLLLLRAFRKEDRRTAIVRVLLDSRRTLRDLARRRLAAETLRDQSLARRLLAAPTPIIRAGEQRRAATLANRVDRLFQRESRNAVTAELRQRAQTMAENRLRLIATNETVRTFEQERLEFAQEVAEATGEDILKRWDAVADANVCEDCLSLDGTEISLDDPFPDGDPPLHPNCRCSIEYIFAT